MSNVEQLALRQANAEAKYGPTEKVRALVVDHFPALGKLSALRFVEWAQQNKGWTISLPTGKTPEHFIKCVSHLLASWKTPETVRTLEDAGIDPSNKPDMRSFHFVQIDEFYPINSWQHNSFYDYVNKFYIDGFGLDPARAMLINPNEIGLYEGEELDEIWPGQVVDLTLRTRPPKTAIEDKQKRVLDAVDQFASDYEARIRELGGIGFFLGGIGPDGHIGFNVRGADHYSTTRLCETNYETQAAAASDLGGIEVSRRRLVITIGLQTITHSPQTTAIIIAAGEAKAHVVKAAIESEMCNQVPASILQKLENASFYITRGGAKHLTERKHLELVGKTELSELDKALLVTDVALTLNKNLTSLSEADIKTHRSGPAFLKKMGQDLQSLLQATMANYADLIRSGLEPVRDQVFLHTAPHHDDIMLAYLPYLVRLMREQSNDHYFNYLTSGFNAVTNSFMLGQLKNARYFLEGREFGRLVDEDYFAPKDSVKRDNDVYRYLDGLAANDKFMKREGQSRRFLRCLNELYGDNSQSALTERLLTLETYFQSQYPGKKDSTDIQQLKGMVREWEADVLWGYYGFLSHSVIHSRLGFYKGDIFTEEPEVDRDVLPVVQTLKRVNPTIVTVALDPEGSGPDTHYKVLQAISSALKIYVQESGRSDIQVWGYRNVWYRYHPTEANLFVPVTFNGMAILNDSFLNSFHSQADASFPSYDHDGPFSGLARQIQVEQYQFMKTVLGQDFFYQNPDSRIRSARGFVYLKAMGLDEFHQWSRTLRETTESSS